MTSTRTLLASHLPAFAAGMAAYAGERRWVIGTSNDQPQSR